MEINPSIARAREKEIPSPTTSPHSNGSSTTLTPPLTPNPYPTTFVQADTSTFKQVVQMLTGSSSDTTDPPPPSSPARGGGGITIPPIKSTGQKKHGFKLYERRNSLKNGLMINTLPPGFSRKSGLSPRKPPEILSPSILDFPALALISPVTPLNEDTLSRSSVAAPPSPVAAEEKAIAEKKFYFHPSPRTNAEPQLLSLFPVTSPRVPGSSS